MHIPAELETAVREAATKVRTAVREIAKKDPETSWMQRVIYGEIALRAQTRGPAFWDDLYPGLSAEQRAAARIQRMIKRATLAGVAAASGASSTQILALVTDGLAVPIAVPAGMLAVGAELLYNTALRIDLAFDLGSIYGVPFAADDVGPISTLLAIQTGIPLTNGSAPQRENGRPEPTNRWRLLSEMEDSNFARRIGKQLLQQTLLRNVIPVVGIVVSAVWNQVELRRYARAVDAAVRHRRALVRACGEVDLASVRDPRVILDGAWLLATASGPPAHTEVLALSTLVDTLPAPARLPVNDGSFNDDESVWLEQIPTLDPSTREVLVRVLKLIAIVDGRVGVPERRFLARVAHALGQPIDLGLPEDASRAFRPSTSDQALAAPNLTPG